MAAHPVYFQLGQDSFRGDTQEEWITEDEDSETESAEASIDMYNHLTAAVDTYDTTPTTAVSNTQTTADLTAIGMDATMMRHLFDNEHASGMAFLKRTDQGAVGGSGSNRWGKALAESWSNIAAAHAALTTLITGRGDTVDPKGFFLSVGYEEGVLADSATDAAFKVDLKQFILDLRTDYGAEETPVVIDLPPASFTGSTSSQDTSLVNARQVIKEVSSEDAFVSYVSSDGLPRSNGTIKWYYTGAATMTQGTAMGKEMARLVTGKGTNPGLGAPVYILLGDDNCVGTAPGTFITDGADEDYSNTNARVKTWNWSNSTWESMTATTNSNTSTDGASTFGPDVSMGEALTALHPDLDVYVFKLGRLTSSIGNGSSTGGSWPAHWGDIYDEVVADWGLAKSALDSVEFVVPDVRGLALIFGQEDVNTQTLADGYLSNLRNVISDYRAIFQTRVDGDNLGVAIVRMQDTGAYTQEYVNTVRSSSAAAADEDPRAKVVDLDSARTNADGLTLSGGGTLDAGRAIATAFGELNA